MFDLNLTVFDTSTPAKDQRMFYVLFSFSFLAVRIAMKLEEEGEARGQRPIH